MLAGFAILLAKPLVFSLVDITATAKGYLEHVTWFIVLGVMF